MEEEEIDDEEEEDDLDTKSEVINPPYMDRASVYR